MIRHTIRRLQRMPVPAIGVLLFAAILAMVLCSLQKANEEEMTKYQETYHAIPVEFTVTNLSGTKSTDLNISSWFAEAFASGLASFITDLQKVCNHRITGQNSGYILFGITSTALSPELRPENGCHIQWREGYDEGIFVGSDLVCLVPDSMPVSMDEETGIDYVELDFTDEITDDPIECSYKLQVIGTYKGGAGNAVYCPFSVCKQVYSALGETFSVQAIRATLKNNDDLEELHREAKKWFAEPNPLGEQTPWGEHGYAYYPFALDINDDLLQRTSATLQNSITTNRICAVLVLCLSAAAGLLIGFLMVRNRKREIALMRTMGTPDRSIYVSFMLEQMLCFGVGILCGGAYNRWRPTSQLAILAVVFFAGLTAALRICLRKNLMTTIKEED